MVAYRGKRVLDLGVALPALLVSLPLQLVVAALVRIRLGSPVLFRQQRPGLDGQPFELVKFRTMLPPDTSRGLGDVASRGTSRGALLRSAGRGGGASLWNVIRGDMSLVGPRPLLMAYLDRYTPEQAHRHSVRPGLTGLAQISGRNAVSWSDRFRLDLEYVRTQNLSLDLRILAMTVKSVIRREGIAAQDHVTMREFLDPTKEAEG